MVTRNIPTMAKVTLSHAYDADVLAGKYPGLTVLGAPVALTFDQNGTLTTPWLP